MFKATIFCLLNELYCVVYTYISEGGCCETGQKQIAMNELSVSRVLHAGEGAQLVL